MTSARDGALPIPPAPQSALLAPRLTGPCGSWAVVLVPALACLCLSRPALADVDAPPTLCLVQEDPVPGLDPESLRVAVALEKRRARAVFNRVDAPSLDDCPAGEETVVVVVGAGDAWWQGADGAPRAMETASMDARDRAPEVARRVVAVLAAPPGEGARPIVDGEVREPPAATAPGGVPVARAVASPGDRLEGYLRVGGRYEYQPGVRLHAGAVDVEAGVSLLGERLAVGLKGGWQPAASVRGDAVTARVTAGPLALMVRGGLKWPRVRVRLGLGAGLEWRRVELRSEGSSRRPADTRVFPTLEGEVEVAFPFARSCRVVVAGTVRGFPAWTRYAWAGRTVLEGPRAGVGAALRLEALFGEGAP